MIDFKTVCGNFNIIFNNKIKSNENLFLNADFNIINNVLEKASLKDIISSLQNRKWTGSTEEESIKRIWIQTKVIYSEEFNQNIKDIQDFYQKSIIEGSFCDLSKLNEYASIIKEKCELLLISKGISSVKKYLDQPSQELIQPICEKFNREVEEKYTQSQIFQKEVEFHILRYWEENDKDKFFSVFFEEENGKIEESFPELLKIYQTTKNFFSKKKTYNYSYKGINKKLRENKCPKVLRNHLLEILNKKSFTEIPILDKLKFTLFKNSILLSTKDFCSFYASIKKFNEFYEDKGFLKDALLYLESSFKKMNTDQYFSDTLERILDAYINVLKNDIFLKQSDIKQNIFNNGLVNLLLGLVKIQNSDIFDRKAEKLTIQSFISKFPYSQKSIENSKTYHNLFQELEKIKGKLPVEKQKTIYKISKRTETFFLLFNQELTQLPAPKEYINLDLPVLQSIFKEQEIEKITELLILSQSLENAYYEGMIKAMFESKLELSQSKEEATLFNTFKDKNKVTSLPTLNSEKKSSHQQNIENWKKIIPLKKQNIVELNYPPHVTRWFENPRNALEDLKYISIIKRLGRETVQYFHSFPTYIDTLVGTEYSLEYEVYNKRTQQNDKLYGIPGEMEIQGKKYRGFFQYIIDGKSGICYHRCFNDRSKNFLEDIVEKKIWYPNDFPTLAESKSYTVQKMKMITSENANFHYDPVLRKIFIKTELMNIVIFQSFDNDLLNQFFTFFESK